MTQSQKYIAIITALLVVDLLLFPPKVLAGVACGWGPSQNIYWVDDTQFYFRLVATLMIGSVLFWLSRPKIQ